MIIFGRPLRALSDHARDSKPPLPVGDQRARMAKAKNIIWIMCDQLRHDYLGRTGHPTLKTPNIDAMAARGVHLTNAYVQ
jgi:membrane-anchored protein YejM (alkaline phosphatase superfamily)